MGNIGSLSSVGKIENGGGGGSNLQLKKIYRTDGGSYITCLLPASVQSFTDLINYMTTNLPYNIGYYNRTLDSVPYKIWVKTTSINCSGVYYLDDSHGVELFFELHSRQSYNGDPNEDVDMSQFVTPTSLTTFVLYRTSSGSPGSRLVTLNESDGWLIADV